MPASLHRHQSTIRPSQTIHQPRYTCPNRVWVAHKGWMAVAILSYGIEYKDISITRAVAATNSGTAVRVRGIEARQLDAILVRMPPRPALMKWTIYFRHVHKEESKKYSFNRLERGERRVRNNPSPPFFFPRIGEER